MPRRTVLLVDDNEGVRQSLRLLLRWSGSWDVVGEAADGARAIDLVVALRPDLVLLDRWLADGDGLRIVPQLLAIDRPPRLAILSAEPKATLMSQTEGLSDAIYLNNMTPPLDLLAALNDLMDLSTQ